MLLKSLPFSQKKEKNQNLNLKESLQSQKQNEAFLNLGLNLLSSTDTTNSNNPSILKNKKIKFISDDSDEVVPFFKKLILCLCILFSVVIILNLLTTQIIKSLKVKQDSLIRQVQSYSEIEKSAKYVDKRVSYYKKILSQRESMSPRLDFILSNTDESIYIKDARYSLSSFSIFAEGPNAYTFTNLISKYLSGGVVSEISIKGARLNTRTGMFEVDMEGRFK